MKDFIEQEVCSTSQLKSSQDTPTVSDNPLDTDTLADPELTAETILKLAPYREALINNEQSLIAIKENTN